MATPRPIRSSADIFKLLRAQFFKQRNRLAWLTNGELTRFTGPGAMTAVDIARPSPPHNKRGQRARPQDSILIQKPTQCPRNTKGMTITFSSSYKSVGVSVCRVLADLQPMRARILAPRSLGTRSLTPSGVVQRRVHQVLLCHGACVRGPRYVLPRCRARLAARHADRAQRYADRGQSGESA